MRKFLLSIVGVCALFSATGFAAEPTAERAPKEAVRLVSLKVNVLANAIQNGLPPLSSGWSYRAFRGPGPVAGDSSEFMRCQIGE